MRRTCAKASPHADCHFRTPKRRRSENCSHRDLIRAIRWLQTVNRKCTPALLSFSWESSQWIGTFGALSDPTVDWSRLGSRLDHIVILVSVPPSGLAAHTQWFKSDSVHSGNPGPLWRARTRAFTCTRRKNVCLYTDLLQYATFIRLSFKNILKY